ncbi:hypothetical protein CYLTODRAFT_444863 [Cylindrobasidium torrendii FP15055 ss-10]|uniref:HD domain-containing protein n=1 Tax=Cylindrobasidium torrendii FP15055 ss-10 TaxID=1314674 RepID=A0A0D7B9I0_9AGAR|nr:hypothetical protein CYLTODRAFT_444863 [Cylindrobasidium torrendii FP15055 ss-10]
MAAALEHRLVRAASCKLLQKTPSRVRSGSGSVRRSPSVALLSPFALAVWTFSSPLAQDGPLHQGSNPRPHRCQCQASQVYRYARSTQLFSLPKKSNHQGRRQFQRLRNIKQLGTSYYVWPGASHNRFEHCLGVACLARKLLTAIRSRQPELGLTDRDVDLVEIAGLCHDLGHGPWSHVWDAMFMPSVLPDRPWKHEEGSEMMFDFLVKDNNIDIEDADVKLIKDLIAGERRHCDPSEKQFLFDIVANKKNGLDVDKFDYFLRDSRAIGEEIKISLSLLFSSARVIDNEICYDVKHCNLIYEIYNTRFRLHKLVYNHKTAKAIEYMIIDALKLAQNEGGMKIAERVFDPESMCTLTDELMSLIEYMSITDPKLKPAADMFQRIKQRKLYKQVDFKTIQWAERQLFEQNVTREKIVEAAKLNYNKHMDDRKYGTDKADDKEEGFELEDPENLEVDDVIISLSPMHYGMGPENPVDHVKFYSRQSLNQSRSAQLGDYSILMPPFFGEISLRVYTKKPEYYYNVQAGYRAVVQELREKQGQEVRSDLSVPTPPLTPLAPTTGPRSSSGGLRRTASASLNENPWTTVKAGFQPPGTPSPKKRKASVGEEDAPEAKRRS